MQMWESQGCVSILQCPGQRWCGGLQGYQSTQEESESKCVYTLSQDGVTVPLSKSLLY